jgi:hypothetical protein
MRLRLNLCDVDLQLKISGWRESENKEDWDDNWCYVELTLNSQYINYSPSGEILMSREVLWLKEVLHKLISGELERDYSLEFTEPDLQFDLRIAKRLYNIPGKIIFPKEYQDVDIDGDLIINFWCSDGLGCNTFSMGLDRSDLTNFYNYLRLVTNEIGRDDLLIRQMLENGKLLPE